MLWNSAALALATALLLNGEPWTVELKGAITLNRKGEYRQALAKYTALLSTAPVRADAEIHAYVLSQMADATIELGAYVEAETKTREALRLLASAHKPEGPGCRQPKRLPRGSRLCRRITRLSSML